VVRRGEIYWCDFGEPEGHEPGLRRPALVITPEALNRFGIPVVLPITRTARGYPTHVELDGILPVTCYIQCELIRAVAASRLGQRLATVPVPVLAQVTTVLRRILVL
jgi:mRNA interferase MazF